MRSRSLLLLLLLFAFAITAFGAAVKTTRKVFLGESEVTVNVYENAGSSITFVVPHHNEQTGLKLAREYVDRFGGRLIEIESFDKKGNPARYLNFSIAGKNYTVDPNRIFTANGRSCAAGLAEVGSHVEAFAQQILNTMFVNGKDLSGSERFIVAVHNNTDVEAKLEGARPGDLTALAFVKTSFTKEISHGIFQEQAEGVYLSNAEEDPDNFIFLSGQKYVSYFAEKGFNVVVQKSAAKLQSQKCNVDDGSLSVYSAQKDISYICLEADGRTGGFRQRQMMDAVYKLAKAEQEIFAQPVAQK